VKPWEYVPGSDRLQAVVAEVSNTPWRETHYYVLSNFADSQMSSAKGSGLTAQHAKTFHVSPFMDMDSRYEWYFSVPGETLDLQLISHNPQHPFVANLSLRRRPMSNRSLAKLLLRHPCMPGQITARIYYQALKLWWKRCPFYPHPNLNKAHPTTVSPHPPNRRPRPSDRVTQE
jgi:DUF1365 family protein